MGPPPRVTAGLDTHLDLAEGLLELSDDVLDRSLNGGLGLVRILGCVLEDTGPQRKADGVSSIVRVRLPPRWIARL